MNERINNLIEQSGFGSYAEIPDTYIVHKNDLAEFAELIVRECSDIVEGDIGVPWEVSGRIIKKIKQHFGVEL